ncbi:COX15/CtaA family protein [Oerskovia flava]|uniref:COX15/CtaA family protein n=1 Tax=Oerskovia flava TaxID=2986422 RepID=UPI00223F5C43|nr:COX15/CtaA family protein [Oerskovia sp. JB1-3-2]
MSTEPAATADDRTDPDTAAPHDRLARWRPTTRGFLVANVVAQVGIIVTGGAVRLTGSGLGCSTWPQCEPGQFTPVFHEATSLHPYIEFGNRTLTGVLAVIALAVAVMLWTDRSRTDAFRRLGLVPLAGVAVQAVIGGITVLLELHPAVVAVHFLVSAALVWVSTYLLYRYREGDGAPRQVVGTTATRTGRVLGALLVPVLVLGVLVTGSGPHGGDDDVPYRFALDPVLVTRYHALSVWAFLVALAVLVVLVWRAGAPAATTSRARRAVLVLVAVTLLQGAIGYVQYFTGLPELLVGLHMLGAALLVVSTTWTLLTLRERHLVVRTPVRPSPVP